MLQATIEEEEKTTAKIFRLSVSQHCPRRSHSGSSKTDEFENGHVQVLVLYPQP